MARRIEMDHKARSAWIKSGDHTIASFDFDHWGGANKAKMAAANYIQTRHENPWEMADRIKALEAEKARYCYALKAIANLETWPDNLMGDKDIARAALTKEMQDDE